MTKPSIFQYAEALEYISNLRYSSQYRLCLLVDESSSTIVLVQPIISQLRSQSLPANQLLKILKHKETHEL